jgi:hypothetical protein
VLVLEVAAGHRGEMILVPHRLAVERQLRRTMRSGNFQKIWASEGEDLSLPLEILHLLVQLPDRLSHLFRILLLPINLPRLLSLQIRLLPSMQTRFAASKLARYLHHTLAAVDHQLHRLAFVLFRIHRVLSLFCFHRVLFLSLSSRVRQIGGGSDLYLLKL